MNLHLYVVLLLTTATMAHGQSYHNKHSKSSTKTKGGKGSPSGWHGSYGSSSHSPSKGNKGHHTDWKSSHNNKKSFNGYSDDWEQSIGNQPHVVTTQSTEENGLQNASIQQVQVEHFDNTFRSADIDIQSRGCDYVTAFERLQCTAPNGNIFAIVDGMSYDRICDMQAMPDASLVLISYGDSSYVQTKVVPVEEIEELGIRGCSRSPIHVYFPQSTDHRPHDHHHVHDVEDIPDHHDHPHVHIHADPCFHDITPRECYQLDDTLDQLECYECD